MFGGRIISGARWLSPGDIDVFREREAQRKIRAGRQTDPRTGGDTVWSPTVILDPDFRALQIGPVVLQGDSKCLAQLPRTVAQVDVRAAASIDLHDLDAGERLKGS